jgi:signal transduction histidine kinase
MNDSTAGKSYQQVLLWNVVITFSYVITSWVFLKIAVPPGYSSPFWPGAGIALAAVLMLGPKVSYGIFLGSWLVNFFHDGVSYRPLQEAMMAVGVATGAMLQALVGRYFVLKFSEKPFRLDRHASAFKFLFVLAPGTCLVSPSVGITSLLLTDTISLDSAMVNWFTWWIGDSFGAAMFLPMILAFSGQPTLLWRPRRLSLCVPAACLIGVLLLLNSKTAEWHSSNARVLIKMQAQQLLNQIEHSLLEKLLIIQSDHINLQGQDIIPPARFQSLLENLQKSSMAVRSLSLMKTGMAAEPQVQFQWNAGKGPVDPYRQAMTRSADKDAATDFRKAEFFAPSEQQLMAYVEVSSVSKTGSVLRLKAVFDFGPEIRQSLDLMEVRNVRVNFVQKENGEFAPTVPGVHWLSSVPRASEKIQLALTLPFSSMLSNPQNEYFLALLFGLVLALTLFSILLVASGQSYRFEMLFLDRSQELKHQQLKAEHSSKMAALGSMAGSIAHEINNPLAIIHGYAKYLLNRLKNDRFELADLKLGLTRIEETSQRISDIIKALRSYARDDRQDDLIDYSAAEIISETIHLCFELLKNKQVSILWNHEQAPGIKFKGRKAALMQILLNLINNSCDAISGLNEKWIQIDLGVRDDTGLIQIRVIDSGPGVPVEIQEKIMQPFFSTKSNGSGTGLGLSISKNLVESMNGTLTLDRSSRNTCFVLSLPGSHSVSDSNEFVQVNGPLILKEAP